MRQFVRVWQVAEMIEERGEEENREAEKPSLTRCVGQTEDACSISALPHGRGAIPGQAGAIVLTSRASPSASELVREAPKSR